MDAEGICRIVILANAEITAENAKQIIAAQAEVMDGQKAPVFTDARQIKNLTHAARTLGVGKESLKINLAVALLIASPVSRILGNLFVNFSHPPFPTRLFTSEASAVEWLKSFIE